MYRTLLFLLTLSLFAPVSSFAQCYDFSDSTFQGWSEGDPLGTGFNGTLSILTSGGNPGVWVQAFDTTEGGGGLFFQAPPAISGNLVGYSLDWDEWIPPDPRVVYSTSVFLVGTNGGMYRSDRTLQGTDEWTPRTVSFSDSTGWSYVQGPQGFFEVTSGVANLYIDLEVVAASWYEGGVDNICLVPEPVPTLVTTWGDIKSRYAID